MSAVFMSAASQNAIGVYDGAGDRCRRGKVRRQGKSWEFRFETKQLGLVQPSRIDSSTSSPNRRDM
jgi:hypothetical protein